MKTFLWITLLVGALSAQGQSTNLAAQLQRGLFEEEANHDLTAARKAYEEVARQFDRDRKLAATAIFRLGEVHRKLGQTNEAVAYFARISREFPDQTNLVRAVQRMAIAQPGSVALPMAVSVASGGQNVSAEEAAVQLEAIGNLPKEKRGTALQMFLRSSVLDDLIQQRTATERRRAEAQQDLSQEHPTVRGLTQTLETLHRQIEEQVEAGMLLLETKAKGARTPTVSALVDEEQRQIDRFLKRHRTSPDAIDKVDPDLDKQIPIIYAATKGYAAFTRCLLTNGSQWVAWALEKAATEGHVGVVEECLKAGADPHGNVLIKAIQGNNNTVVAALLRGGAPSCGTNGFSALHAVARLPARTNLIYRFIEGGCPVDLVENGATPLGMAVSVGNLAGVQALIRLGADVNRQAGGLSLLELAAGSRDTIIVHTLMDAGARISQKAVENAVFADEKILKALLARQPNLSAPISPLHIAVVHGKSNAVPLLLEAGADPNAVTTTNRVSGTFAFKTGETPIERALYNPGMLQTLLKAGADANRPLSDGTLPLHSAIDRGQLRSAALLLDGGAEVNARSGSKDLSALDQVERIIAAGGFDGGGRPSILSSDQKREMANLRTQILSRGGKSLLRETTISLLGTGLPSFEPVFFRDTNNFNKFTLYELLVFAESRLQFPDLTAVTLSRVESDGSVQSIRIDLSALAHASCSNNLALQWQDSLHVPVLNHPRGLQWGGFEGAIRSGLSKCLVRRIRIRIGTDETERKLDPTAPDNRLQLMDSVLPGKQDSPWLDKAVANSPLRSSSDLSRVRVRRKEPGSSEERVIEADLSKGETPPHRERIWLMDGDIVEIPDKRE